MIYAWGQFLDHDLDLTHQRQPGRAVQHPRARRRPVLRPGTAPAPRSSPSTAPCPCPAPAPAPATRGSSSTTSPPSSTARWSTAPTPRSPTQLRTFAGGRLKTSPGRTGDRHGGRPAAVQQHAPTSPDQCGAADGQRRPHRARRPAVRGRRRAGQREHRADQPAHPVRPRAQPARRRARARPTPAWSDETIYQLARRQRQRRDAGHHLQRVAARPCSGRTRCRRTAATTPNVNPGIANEFSTAAVPPRPQHARRRRRVPRQRRPAGRRGDPAERGLLQPAGSSQETGIDPILKYLASDPSSELDNTIVEQRAQLPVRPARAPAASTWPR